MSMALKYAHPDDACRLLQKKRLQERRKKNDPLPTRLYNFFSSLCWDLLPQMSHSSRLTQLDSYNQRGQLRECFPSLR